MVEETGKKEKKTTWVWETSTKIILGKRRSKMKKDIIIKSIILQWVGIVLIITLGIATKMKASTYIPLLGISIYVSMFFICLVWNGRKNKKANLFELSGYFLMMIGGLALWPHWMGINWMTRAELTQAIPPAYTEYIGKYLMEAVKQS